MTVNVLPPIVPGDDYPLVFTFSTNGVVEDQTGNSLRVMVKSSPDAADDDALTDETVAASSPDAEAGIIRVTLPDTDTREYPEGTVYVQARRTTASGVKQSPLLVELKVLNSVIDDA